MFFLNLQIVYWKWSKLRTLIYTMEKRWQERKESEDRLNILRMRSIHANVENHINMRIHWKLINMNAERNHASCAIIAIIVQHVVSMSNVTCFGTISINQHSKLFENALEVIFFLWLTTQYSLLYAKFEVVFPIHFVFFVLMCHL